MLGQDPEEPLDRPEQRAVHHHDAVARAVAAMVLPTLGRMYQDKGVELRGCDATRKILAGIHAAIAVMVALAERDRTGRGQVVEAPMIGAALT